MVVAQMGGNAEAGEKFIGRKTALKRMGEPDEVAPSWSSSPPTTPRT
jgi:hypothetical protein